MRAQLAALPPLHVTKLPSRDGGRPEVLSSALYRKTDQLLETLLQMSANVKVVDITGKSPGTRKTFFLVFRLHRIKNKASQTAANQYKLQI